MGLHKVLYPWLVVGVLNESPSRLGLATMAMMLPNLLFILPGGVISDRRHRGSWLSFLFLLYLLPLGILLASVLNGSLTFNLLLLFGVAFGTILAFVQPARESLLGYAAPEIMHQAVAKVMMVQFIAQGVGFMIAGQLDNLSLEQLLGFQMLVFLASSLLMKRCHPLPKVQQPESTPIPQSSDKPTKQTWSELREGLQLFRDDKSLLHLLFIIFATGFLAFGVYLVGMPLIARELYNGGAGLYSALQVTFSIGIVSANFAVMKQSSMFKRPGRLMVISFLMRGSLVGIIATVPSMWVLFPVVYIWGVFSGLSMTLGRTILHNQVSHKLRSRAASVYQLCLFGGAPLGAWVCGITIEAVGLSAAFVAIASTTLLVSILTAWKSPLWQVVGKIKEVK
ncbi:MAG: MFS transporter [Porticoccaceae bacterium]|nr:MFS transporter [Porticoccaceae bacterium]MBT5578051.1 MFS transporter [Porticoccaceae bacterium]MBT7374544.1 MFS transporter [Porticoccaceae bacterium]